MQFIELSMFPLDNNQYPSIADQFEYCSEVARDVSVQIYGVVKIYREVLHVSILGERTWRSIGRCGVLDISMVFL
jgi:hypothetical protein